MLRLFSPNVAPWILAVDMDLQNIFASPKDIVLEVQFDSVQFNNIK